MANVRNLRQLHNYLAPLMADDRPNRPIGEVLAEQAVKQREAKERKPEPA